MNDACDPHCPFLGCASCAYAGGVATQPNRHISAGQSARIVAAKTNGPGLAPETVLATPIRASEQEDYPKW